MFDDDQKPAGGPIHSSPSPLLADSVQQRAEYRGRILMLDDDPRICQFYSAFFSKEGYIASTCTNLKELRLALDVHTYDAVFLDLNLGTESGIEWSTLCAKASSICQSFHSHFSRFN